MRRVLATAVMMSLCALTVLAQTVSDPNLTIETVVSGLSQPIAVAFLDADDFLVIEKATGRVKRVVNGIVTATVLDLPVANNSERGLLGITLDPNFDTNSYVYLYYSRAASDGGTWLDNRVERYTWNGSALVSPVLLISFPSSGTLANGPNHDGGVILFGPDGKLYGGTGDLNRNGLEQNFETAGVSDVGGIFRLNPDGSNPADNPFIGDSHPEFQRLYTYGYRNGFGQTFDSWTGWMWDTENGPSSYDEVNLVLPGLNSGWEDIMGPDSRDPQNVSDLYMIPNAFYSDPEFSWLTPVGVTSIVFLGSAKWDTGLRGRCLVGDNNNGFLYLFEMNGNRDGFVLTGGLADLVADSSAERDQVRWGSGWGVVTDLREGPDGNLYAVSLTLGRVYRVRPTTEPKTISGRVVLGDYEKLPTGVSLTIEVRDGSTVVETLNTTLGAFGDFSVRTSVDASDYLIWLKASHWLAVSRAGVSFNTNSVMLGKVPMPINGDADDSNGIDVLDVNKVLLDFGGTTTDLNGNGLTDLPDLNITLLNFGLIGD